MLGSFAPERSRSRWLRSPRAWFGAPTVRAIKRSRVRRINLSRRPLRDTYTRDLALPVGARLGPHDILSAPGSGGMSEVYRPRDTKLGSN
jgi:hypothetical protein